MQLHKYPHLHVGQRSPNHAKVGNGIGVITVLSQRSGSIGTWADAKNQVHRFLVDKAVYRFRGSLISDFILQTVLHPTSN